MNATSLHGAACVLVAGTALSGMLWLVPVDAQGPPASPGKPPEHKAAPPPDRPSSDHPKEPDKVVTSPILIAKLALMADPRLFPYDITVEMNGDALLLKGKVPSAQQKTAAAEAVRSVAKSVKNELEVAKDVERELRHRQDEAITRYVKERFAKSKTLETAGFDVNTEDGIVALSGKTRFHVIVLEAAEAARHVPGVKAVKTDGVRLESE